MKAPATFGHIDSATVYEVLHYLQSSPPPTEWTIKGAFTATSLLLDAEHLSISAAPSADGDLTGPYGLLLTAIPELLSRETPTREHRVIAASRARGWARRSTARLRSWREGLWEDPNYQRWRHSPEWVWQDHARRLNGMFDQTFIPVLAEVLDVAPGDLAAILAASRQPPVLSQMRAEIDRTDRGMLLADAYTISTLIRGRYHDSLARLADDQIVHHELRSRVFPINAGKGGYEPSNVERHLAWIVLNVPLGEREYPARIARWADALTKVRRKLIADPKLGLPRAMDEKAIDDAVAIALDANIEVSARVLREAVDLGIAVAASVGVLALGLDPWPTVGAAVGSEVLARRLKVGERAESLGRARRLRGMAQGPGGRVRPWWLV
jgi:hypothetical protein